MSDSDSDDELNITNYLSDYVNSVKKRPEGNFPDCPICYEPLNNFDGPGKSRGCYLNCSDVIKVCPQNHMFHRGCILDTCYTQPYCPLCRNELTTCYKL